MGPLSSTAAADRLQDQLDRAVAQGADVVAGGDADGNYFAGTVLTGHHPGQRRLPRGVLRAGRERLLGSAPRRRRSSSRTTRRSGSAPTSSPTTPSRRCGWPTSLDTGMVFVNGVGADGAELPFGGVKRSGFGRELGRYGIEEFVNKKLIRIGG